MNFRNACPQLSASSIARSLSELSISWLPRCKARSIGCTAFGGTVVQGIEALHYLSPDGLYHRRNNCVPELFVRLGIRYDDAQSLRKAHQTGRFAGGKPPEMAVEGADDAYMFGEGGSCIPFTQRQVLRMLDEFTRERRLSPQERLEIRSWLASLPWIGGWQEALPPSDGRDQEGGYYPVVDNDDGRDGGIIELHFSW